MGKWTVMGLVLSALGIPSAWIYYSKYLGKSFETGIHMIDRNNQIRCDALRAAGQQEFLPEACEGQNSNKDADQ